MSAPTKVVLLSCGSFNPITNMHLRMFEVARDTLHKTGKFRVVGGIISPVNDAYAKKGLVASRHRINMARNAVQSSDWIRVDTWESELDDWSETLKVLRHHKDVLDSMYNANPLPDTPTKKRKIDSDEVDYTIPTHSMPMNLNLNEMGPVQLKLLCGADLLESFAVPGLWKDEDMEEIVGRFGMVCISRSGSNGDKFIYESDVLAKYQNNIHLVTEWISNEISATKIRRALRRHESVKYLLQDSVIDYIKANHLYGCTVTDKKCWNACHERMIMETDETDGGSQTAKTSSRARRTPSSAKTTSRVPQTSSNETLKSKPISPPLRRTSRKHKPSSKNTPVSSKRSKSK